MADMLAYVSADGRERIDLDCRELSAGTALDLRGTSVSCERTARGVTGCKREAREASLEVIATDRDALARLSRVLDRDAMAGAVGYLAVGEWRARAVCTEQDAKFVSPWTTKIGLKFTLVDGCWRREKTAEFALPSGSGGSGSHDLPYDLDYDLLAPPPVSTIEVGGNAAAHVRIVVYGHASNPYVIIGKNRYQVDATVPQGGYMVIDSMEGTVTITDSNGDTSNAFAKAHRGRGKGGGEYIFERVPVGAAEVSSDGSFGFDLTVYEEEAAPPWN